MTILVDNQSVFAAMRAGARGYVLKGAKHDEMLRAIRAVASGESNADIACCLTISVKTVRKHASNGFSRLQVAGRGHTFTRAREAGPG